VESGQRGLVPGDAGEQLPDPVGEADHRADGPAGVSVSGGGQFRARGPDDPPCERCEVVLESGGAAKRDVGDAGGRDVQRDTGRASEPGEHVNGGQAPAALDPGD